MSSRAYPIWSMFRTQLAMDLNLAQVGTSFMDLPYFVRGIIFKYLSYKNQRNVGLTCKMLQWNVNFSIQVRAILDSDSLKKFKRSKALYCYLEEFLTWLETARVQTLRVSNIQSLVFDVERFFRNRLITRLVITLDSIQTHPESLSKYRHILSGFQGMKALELRFNNPSVPYDGRNYYKAHRSAYQFVANLLNDLVDKPNLEELSIFICSLDNSTPGGLPGGLPLQPPAPIVPQQPLPTTTIFPFKLKILNLCLQDLSLEAGLAWQVMLDQQDSLQSLAVDLGKRLGTDIYEMALVKSSWSLVLVSLKLYAQRNESQLRNTSLIRWSAVQQQSLESLKIWFDPLDTADLSISFPSWSFLPLHILELLDLKKVMLTLEDLTLIFRLPSKLKLLRIRYWTVETDFKILATHTRTYSCEIIRLLIEYIERRQFHNIQLEDQCLKYCIWKQLHGAVLSSPYAFVRDKANWASRKSISISRKLA